MRCCEMKFFDAAIFFRGCLLKIKKITHLVCTQTLLKNFIHSVNTQNLLNWHVLHTYVCVKFCVRFKCMIPKYVCNSRYFTERNRITLLDHKQVFSWIFWSFYYKINALFRFFQKHKDWKTTATGNL